MSLRKKVIDFNKKRILVRLRQAREYLKTNLHRAGASIEMANSMYETRRKTKGDAWANESISFVVTHAYVSSRKTTI